MRDGQLSIGDLVRVKTHSDPIMRVVDIAVADDKSGAESVAHCEWEDYGTEPPIRRSFCFALDDLVPVSQRRG